MIKRKYLFWFKILLVMLSVGCQNKSVEIPSNENQTISKQEFLNSILIETKNKRVEGLNLNHLENAIDSFELRLWINEEATNGGQILIIKKLNAKWVCLDYSYLEKENDNPDLETLFDKLTAFEIDTFWVSKKQPQSNWASFFSAIEKEQIFDLPTQTDLVGWENKVFDGYTFSIEFVHENKYRYYTYNCPDVCENEFEACKQMTNMLHIFDKAFGIKIHAGFRCHKV